MKNVSLIGGILMKLRNVCGAAAGLLLFIVQPAVLASPIALNLQDCIRLALANNASIKIAAADNETARWSLEEKQAGYRPVINFTHLASRRLPSPTTSNPYPVVNYYFDNTVSLSLPIYSGGKLEAQENQAKFSLQSAGLELKKTRQQMKYEATNAYFTVLQARNVLQLEKESVQRLQQHLQNVNLQFTAGTVAKSDVLRSEVELADEEQTLITAENSYDVAVSSLNNVIGMPLATEISIKEALTYQKNDKPLNQFLVYAGKHHPTPKQIPMTRNFPAREILTGLLAL